MSTSTKGGYNPIIEGIWTCRKECQASAEAQRRVGQGWIVNEDGQIIESLLVSTLVSVSFEWSAIDSLFNVNAMLFH